MSNDAHLRRSTLHSSPSALDAVVLGTVNAPYKSSMSASKLASVLATGNTDNWLVHVSTFFTDVRPALVIDFATNHGIQRLQLERVYASVKLATGERHLALEEAFVALAQAA
jgi:hypothetical protein